MRNIIIILAILLIGSAAEAQYISARYNLRLNAVGALMVRDTAGNWKTVFYSADTLNKWQPKGNYLIPSDTSNKWQGKNNYLLPVDTVNKWQGKGAYLLPADTVNKWLGKTSVVPFSQGGIGSSAATSATTGTMTVNMTNEMITITPSGACTFNASGGVDGQRVTFIITTSGTTSRVLTFGTNFRSAGTLATGTTSAKIFTVSFVYNGSLWIETGRTAAQ